MLWPPYESISHTSAFLFLNIFPYLTRSYCFPLCEYLHISQAIASLFMNISISYKLLLPSLRVFPYLTIYCFAFYEHFRILQAIASVFASISISYKLLLPSLEYFHILQAIASLCFPLWSISISYKLLLRSS